MDAIDDSQDGSCISFLSEVEELEMYMSLDNVLSLLGALVVESLVTVSS